MLDIKFIRENPEIVKENIRKKFQNAKLPLVDEVIALDAERRAAINEGETLKAERNKLSKANGPLFGKLKKCADEAEKAAIQAEIDANNAAVKANAERMAQSGGEKGQRRGRHEQAPAGDPPDHRRVRAHRPRRQLQRGGGAVRRAEDPGFRHPLPHRDHGALRRHRHGRRRPRVRSTASTTCWATSPGCTPPSLAYGRDFMIDRGFTYCIPPFMIHGNVVEGVMSQTDMDAMMYKIEGEDLYLIGTSEHSMIGKFIDQIVPEDKLPQTLTSYSPCFRKEKGAHGIEERGVYRIHQFEKQEMIVVCTPEDSKAWYEKMWRYSVELFRSLDIPVRQLECCSGDLADLKCKSCDIEAWSPRQQKYFEVCSCSNLGDAQARRLKIRVRGEDGKLYLPHTLNNTVVAPPRMLIALLENNLQADGSVLVPKALQPYMGGKERLVPLH